MQLEILLGSCRRRKRCNGDERSGRFGWKDDKKWHEGAKPNWDAHLGRSKGLLLGESGCLSRMVRQPRGKTSAVGKSAYILRK